MSRGQVAIRLSLRDQEAFRRQMEAIGPDAEKTFDRMMRAARPVDQRLKIIDQAANDLKSSVQDLGRQAGPAGAFLTTLGGPLALAAAAALGAVALAVREVLVLMERSREAAAYASGLEDTARAAGVAMSAVQDMATTVQLAGGSFEAGTQALEQWAIRLGRVRALGQGETFDALQVMGLGADSFAGMNAAEALDLVIERLLEIDDISTRLALADRLGLASMSELLRRNADDVRNLRVEAESINTALSEATLRRLAEAADEMDRLRTRQERAEAVQGAAAVELELRRQRALTALEERKAALFARRLPLEERTAEMLDAQRISLEAQIENLRLMGPEMRGMADAAAAELDQIIQRRADLADEMERAAAAAEREARAMATVPETGFRGPFSDPDEAYRPPPGPPELDLTRRRQLEALVESSLRSLMTPLQQVAELEAELNLARENGIEITEAQIARIVQLRREQLGLVEAIEKLTEAERKAMELALPRDEAAERQKELLRSLTQPAEELAQRLDDLYAVMARSPEHADTLIAEISRVKDALYGDDTQDFDRLERNVFGGLAKMAEDSRNLESQLDRAGTGAISDFAGFLDDLESRAMSVGEAFSEMADIVISALKRIMIERYIIGPLADALFGALDGAFSGGAKGTSVKAGVRHAGGPINASGPHRDVPLSALGSARVMHSGGYLAPDEHLIIGRDRERMLNPSEDSALFRLLDRLGQQVSQPTPALAGPVPLDIRFHGEREAGVRAQEGERRGGSQGIDVIFEKKAEAMFSSGRMDRVMLDRYGVGVKGRNR